MKNRLKYSLLMALAGLAVAAQPLGAQSSFVRNPSFESNINETWPHYGSIDGWEGGNGVNEVSGPFHNSQTPIPDQTRAAFKQGNGTLGQDISNLTPGQQYWVQFFYDARSGSQKVDITVSFNGVAVGKLVNVQPAYTKNVPYYFASFPFTPDVDAGKLLFTVTVTGDSTALFDAVTIVPRDASNVMVANPSFEASGDVADDGIIAGALAGWTATGRYGVNNTDGTGPYANNGTAPDQDHVAVLNDVSSISQVVNGIVPGKPYQLSFAYNAKSGTTPHLQVKVGDAVAFEENVTAVGGINPYRTKTVTFTATDFSAQITLAQTAAGDQTLLLDDIKLVGESAQPLPPLSITPSVAEISPGQQLTVTVTVPDLLLMTRDINLKLRSLSPAVARLVGADADGVVTLHYAKGSSSSQPLEVVGLARGSALLDVLDNAGLKVLDTLMTYVVTSLVKNPSFESAAAPAGVGYGEILGWTGGSGVNAAGMPFLDNGLLPDRAQVGFIQGSKTLSQAITGLTPGENYWLQFFYNAREFGTGGWKLNLSVKFAGQELAQINEIQAVGAGNPFNFKNVTFKPTSDSGLLEFTTTVEGDATLLLDAISIVERDPVDLVVKNPSFEASGTIVGGVGYLTGNPLAGWDFQAAGFGINVLGRDPFSDNGRNPDQDAVLFIQNAGSTSQTLTGLTPGKKYTALLWVNPRNCCGGAIETTFRVSFDDVVLLEELIQPVGGSNPYPVKQVTFTASGSEGVLKVEHAPEAGMDRSLVIDNVRVVPEGQIPPIILTDPQGASLLEGGSVTLSVLAMGMEPLSYQWQLNGKDLPGKTNEMLELNSISPDQSGQYTVVVRNSVGQKTSRLASVQVPQYPLPPRVQDSGADSLVVIEAERFDANTPAGGTTWRFTTEFPGFSGEGAMQALPNAARNVNINISASPRMDYVVKFVTTGTHYIWVRGLGDSAPGPSADDSVNIGLDWQLPATSDRIGTFPQGAGFVWSQSTFEGPTEPARFEIDTPGNHLVTVWMREDGFTIDKLIITTNPDYTPPGLGPADTRPENLPPASLAVSLQGSQVKLSWPASATGFVLQSAPGVGGPYTNDSTPAVGEGDRLVVTVSPTGTAKFYRLIKTP